MLLEDVARSIPREPEDKSSCYTIIFKYNDNSFQRTFSPSDKVQDLINYVKVSNKLLDEIELFEPFPRKIYNNVGLKLSEAGLSKNQILMVKIKTK